MIPKIVKIQLAAFGIIGIGAMTYAGASVVLPTIVTPTYSVKAEFKDGGGTFKNGEVTYRGVNVGRIASTRLTSDGVEITLEIEKRTPKIPQDLIAVVANKSAVGEQYVDLLPQSNDGPYLSEGSVIPQSKTKIPVPINNLVVDLEKAVAGVNLDDLHVLVDELAKASENTAPSVQRLIDNSQSFTATLQDSLPDTLRLINSAQANFETARDTASQLRQFAQGLSALSQQLVTSDPDVRKILDAGVVSSKELDTFLTQVQPDLFPLLGNLVTASQITAARVPGLKQTLMLLPVAASNLAQSFHDGEFFSPLTVGEDTTPKCTYPATRRLPTDLSTPTPQNMYCKDDHGSSVPRGARNAPRPAGDTTGGPATGPNDIGGPNTNKSSTPLVAAYSPATGLAVSTDGSYFTVAKDVGLTAEERERFGDRPWMKLLMSLIAT